MYGGGWAWSKVYGGAGHGARCTGGLGMEQGVRGAGHGARCTGGLGMEQGVRGGGLGMEQGVAYVLWSPAECCAGGCPGEVHHPHARLHSELAWPSGGITHMRQIWANFQLSGGGCVW